MGKLRALIFRHRARAGIEFLRWMDRLMFVQGYNHQQKKQAWQDFNKSAYSRRAVLDQLSVGLGLKIKREHRTKQEEAFLKLAGQFSRLQNAAHALYVSACWTATGIPPDIQAVMWERLRDALDLAKGTATAKGVAPAPVPPATPSDPPPCKEETREVHPA